jgi:hypothetical protein
MMDQNGVEQLIICWKRGEEIRGVYGGGWVLRGFEIGLYELMALFE